jgi:hypothetical protein
MKGHDVQLDKTYSRMNYTQLLILKIFEQIIISKISTNTQELPNDSLVALHSIQYSQFISVVASTRFAKQDRSPV